jgi:hypothetical protein
MCGAGIDCASMSTTGHGTRWRAVMVAAAGLALLPAAQGDWRGAVFAFRLIAVLRHWTAPSAWVRRRPDPG